MKPLLLICVVALLGDCGPTEAEIGQSMLMAAFPLLAIGIMLERIHVAIAYRNLDTQPQQSFAPMASLAAAISFTLFLTIALRGSQGWEDVGVVGAIMGTGYTGYLGLAFLLLHRDSNRNKRNASVLAVVVPMLIVTISWFGTSGTRH